MSYTKDPMYTIWYQMIYRCTNPKHPSFSSYGGRGIDVCHQWTESFHQFKEDMGARPHGLSIDRINNNLGYYPKNCRWATDTEQMDNRSNSRVYTYMGRTKTLKEWASHLNINANTLKSRIYTLNWSIEKCMEWAPNSGYRGVYKCIKTNKWKASITKNKIFMHLGYFKCKHKAAEAYNKAAFIHHGEFAYFNEVSK